MRPTGRLHIGHYFGALENWVRLQNACNQETEFPVPEYECFYFIADWHALTSDYADTSGVAQNTIEIMTDYLAAGLNPNKDNCTIFLQSLVPEHAELHLLLSMVTPLGWLERVPTYKEALENIKHKDLHNYGFLGYPCLQTADIVIYSEVGTPLFVPVGEDQVSHVELSREIVRRFRSTFDRIDWDQLSRESLVNLAAETEGTGVVEEELDAEDWSTIKARFTRRWEKETDQEIRRYITQMAYSLPFDIKGSLFAETHTPLIVILREPDVMLTKTPRIPGLDGRKMSKSYGNAITLSETDEEIRKKTKVMVTDPARKRRTDPGNPDVCPVYDWHKLFSAGEPGRLEWVRQGCTTAGIGCIECKAAMAENLIKWIAPVRDRRVEYEKRPGRVLEMIDEGSKKARVEAKKTMERVREAVFGWEKKRKELRSGAQ
jgi:tryptophanyl-tRNA synthetase